MKIFQLIDWLTKLFKLNNRSKVILLILLPLPIFSQNNAAFWLGKKANTNLLLDNYPGAAAAYSVRKLDKDYTGFAMEIRRASDNATQNIGFVGEDLDEVAIINFCNVSGNTTCYVKTWYDQSGNGRNATQAIPASQPTIYTGGVVIKENNKPTLDFDGSNDFLSGSVNIIATALGARSVFAVDKKEPTSIIISFRLTKTIFNFSHGVLALGFYYYYTDGVATTNNWKTNTPPSNNLAIVTLLYSGSGTPLNFYENNNLITRTGETGIPASEAGSSGFSIGSRNDIPAYENQKTSEIIVYPSNQSTNRSAIETNINTYFSIY